MNKQALNRRMTILAGAVLVTTLMMMTAPSVFAAPVSKDFKIENFGIDDDGNPSLTVKGTAGGTTTDEQNKGFAYGFGTNKGTFVVASHTFEDSDEVVDDTEWHAHKVQLDSDSCVADLTEQGKAVLDGDTVSVDNTPATEVTNVLTVSLEKDADGKVCATVIDSLP